MTVLNENKKFWDDIVKGGNPISYMGPVLVKEFIKFTELFKTFKGNILDWGCGIGRLMPMFELTDLTGFKSCEISEGMAKIFQEKFKRTCEVIDGIHTPYENNYFDLIWCWSVFTHADEEDVRNILKEMKRILKKEGKIYASYIFNNDLETFSGSIEYINYNKNFFEKIIKEEGFVFSETGRIGEEAGNREQILLEIKNV